MSDIRYALRSLRRRPGFVAAVIATLAGGIGAATAIFSVLNAVVLRPLPYPDPERLVVIGTVAEDGRRVSASAPGDVPDWSVRAPALEAAAASRLESRVVRGAEGDAEEVAAAGVSDGFFDLLGVPPVLGRGFRPGEDRVSAPAVAVLSYGFWQRRFGGDRSVLGRSLMLDGTPFTIVGVLGPSFHPPEAIGQRGVSVWFPLGHIRGDASARDQFFVQAIGRLAPGASLEGARQELRGVGAALSAEHPDAPPHWPVPESLRERTVGDVRLRLVLLSGAVGLLFLMACANVANLFLARAVEREREMAVRVALGAGRRRIVAQLLTEALLLTLVAGLLAVGVAHAAVLALRALPLELPRVDELAIDVRVLGFGFALALGTGLLFGLVPVRTIGGRRHLARALREAGAGQSVGRAGARFRALLVVGQTALSLALLVAAGLLARSLLELVRVDSGFEPEGLAWLDVRVPPEAYPAAARQAFFRDVVERVGNVPGVVAVGGTSALPLSPKQDLTWVTPEGLPLRADETPPVMTTHEAVPGTFETLRVRMLRGREFTRDDVEGRAPVAIVNAAFARAFWPSGEALGRTVTLGRDASPVAATVVGVVEDVREEGLDRPARPAVYVPFTGGRAELWVVARTAGDPGRSLPAMRAAVRALDPSLALDRFGTMEAYQRASIAQPRFDAALLVAFAALAIVLAMVGIYGTTAVAVETRTREAGIRMALGARERAIVALLMRRVAALTAAGLLLGLAVAIGAQRLLEGFLFGVSPADPLTLGVAVGTLAALSLVAAWVPARRAAALDPASALRNG